MYYPYLRGKQFELLLLKENVALIKENDFHPIIEPVKNDFKAMVRTLTELNKHDVNYVLIINPKAGKFPVRKDEILSNLYDEFIKDCDNVNIGFIIHANSKLSEIEDVLKQYPNKNISIIHYGFAKGKELGTLLKRYTNIGENIYIEEYSGKLYRSFLEKEGIKNILIRDGFKCSLRNADYPASEHFSELHATYMNMEKMDGFGDFLIVGDNFSETGGPAYAVAIHLTYIEEKDMYIYHLISDQTKTQTDPGGKFLEALSKLVKIITKRNSPILKTEACNEFLRLHKQMHYPGLGYVKKLSMQHHIELIADYLNHD